MFSKCSYDFFSRLFSSFFSSRRRIVSIQPFVPFSTQCVMFLKRRWQKAKYCPFQFFFILVLQLISEIENEMNYSFFSQHDLYRVFASLFRSCVSLFFFFSFPSVCFRVSGGTEKSKNRSPSDWRNIISIHK